MGKPPLPTQQSQQKPSYAKEKKISFKLHNSSHDKSQSQSGSGGSSSTTTTTTVVTDEEEEGEECNNGDRNGSCHYNSPPHHQYVNGAFESDDPVDLDEDRVNPDLVNPDPERKFAVIRVTPASTDSNQTRPIYTFQL